MWHPFHHWLYNWEDIIVTNYKYCSHSYMDTISNEMHLVSNILISSFEEENMFT